MNSSSDTCCDGDERVDLPSSCYECLYEWVIFGGFFHYVQYLGICCGNM